jgi:hypothetical protein
MGSAISYHRQIKTLHKRHEELIKLNSQLQTENENLLTHNKMLDENMNSMIKSDIRDLIHSEYLIIKQPYKYAVKLKENLLSNDQNIFSDFFELVTFKDSKGYLQYSYFDDKIVQTVLKKYNINMDEYSIIKSKEPNLISVVNFTFVQEYMNKWMNLNIKRISKFENVMIVTYIPNIEAKKLSDDI